MYKSLNSEQLLEIDYGHMGAVMSPLSSIIYSLYF